MSLREKIYITIFGTETPAGKTFDIFLIWAILLSVVILMLESVRSISPEIRAYLRIAEWVLTILFSIEYVLRIYSSPHPFRYIKSFYGIIDLISIIPTFLSLIFPGAGSLLVIRLLRVLRVFRVLKLARYLNEANTLGRAMVQSKRKILIFFSFVLILSTLFGSLMYMVEGPENGFSSIPKSVYWTIVTITTVGYGDITPQTVLGQIISSMAMLTGYSIIAVPTGIFTAELGAEIKREKQSIHCYDCDRAGHDLDAKFCKYCASSLKHGFDSSKPN